MTLGLLPALLPALVFLLLWRAVARQLRTHEQPDRRLSFLLAACVWMLLVFSFTEGLSLFHAIAFWPVAGCWLTAGLLLAVLTWRCEAALMPVTPTNAEPMPWSLLILIGLVLLPSALVALLAPPNNADVLEYHLPRVMHWIQNRSVSHYPTHVYRQLCFGPGMEYILLHVQVLSGSDRLANLTSWLATAAAVVAASWLARALGAGGRGQALAGLLLASMPMTILQASSAKNDPLLVFWLLSFVCFVHAYRHAPTCLLAAAAGSALGLAGFTKGTGYLFGLPLVLYAIVLLRRGLRAQWRHLLLAACLALVINLPVYGRNLVTFGHALGPVEAGSQVLVNELHTPAAFISNVARNLSLHLQVNFNPRFNPALVRLMQGLHDALGLNINDPRTSHGFYFCHAFDWTLWDEKYAGNPAHLFLLLGAVAWGCALWGRRQTCLWGGLLVAALAGFCLFCFALKFQMLHARLHQPLFALAMPAVAAWLGRCRRLPVLLLAILLTALAVPVHLYNRRRPLIGRESVLTTPRLRLFTAGSRARIEPCRALARELRTRNLTQIGLICTPTEDEYQIWACLLEDGPQVFRLEHVGVKNGSRRFAVQEPFSSFRVQAIVYIRPQVVRDLAVCGITYRKVWQQAELQLLVASPLPDGGIEGDR